MKETVMKMKVLNESVPKDLGMTSEQFFPLIGRMTLIHAGIEYDIKGVLSEDWKVPHDKVEGLYGFRLRQFFLKQMKQSDTPEKYYKEYSELIDRYWKASEKRNQLVKASYGLMRNNGEVFQYDRENSGEYDPRIGITEWLEKGGKIISLEEMHILIKELACIREEFFQLCRRVFIENAGRLKQA